MTKVDSLLVCMGAPYRSRPPAPTPREWATRGLVGAVHHQLVVQPVAQRSGRVVGPQILQKPFVLSKPSALSCFRPFDLAGPVARRRRPAAGPPCRRGRGLAYASSVLRTRRAGGNPSRCHGAN